MIFMAENKEQMTNQQQLNESDLEKISGGTVASPTKKTVTCPNCGYTHSYYITGGQYTCTKCKKTFQIETV